MGYVQQYEKKNFLFSNSKPYFVSYLSNGSRHLINSVKLNVFEKCETFKVD